jgi:deoxycytidylate deaminase
MSNILHQLKRGFLILGFTGPLSSGCTTAARFFEKDINSYVDKRTTKVLPKIEYAIKARYNELKDLKKTLQSSGNKNEIYYKIRRLSDQIKEKLLLRETLNILSEYHSNDFKYISMTDVLIKLTLERLSDADTYGLNKTLQKIKRTFEYDTVKLSKVKEIRDQVKNREISDLHQSDIDIYEEFLSHAKNCREKLKEDFSPDELGTLLQDLGDNARRCGDPIDFDSPFKRSKAETLFTLAEEANNLVKFYRNKKRADYGKTVHNEFIIEAFRNPYEAEYFRNRYYEFFLFSIYAPASTRKKRGNYNRERDERDRGQSLKITDFYKQNVTACVHLSDIAINNDTEKKFVFERKLSKFFALICRPGCIPPTEDELFMQQAYCMSLKSNCISRQVGAIIVGKRRYIVGAGWNDVGSGQIPCGLRKYSDTEPDEPLFPITVQGEEDEFRVFLQDIGNKFPQHSFCFKDEYSRFKTSKKVESILANNPQLEVCRNNNDNSCAAQSLFDTVSDQLAPKRLEYCRALHAEENAILQNAIIGGVGIDGATIYTTTFPCELCAKKIYQSRIRKVVFTEPYPGSISEDVFFKDGSHSVELIQFEGVKSHSYYRLYKATIDKKEFQTQERLF